MKQKTRACSEPTLRVLSDVHDHFGSVTLDSAGRGAREGEDEEKKEGKVKQGQP